MRALLVAALVFVAALAGCSGKKGGDEDLHYTCPNGQVIHEDDFEEALENLTEDSQKTDFLKTKCPKAGGSGSSGNKTTTNSAPNVLPIVKLNVTDDGGNATLVTMVDGNLTFDATGSVDPDGQISAIAITIKDSNQTRTRSLYDANTKKFTPQTLKFDRSGPVNVSVAMVDDRAGFTTNVSHVYVNAITTLTGTGLSPMPSTAGDDLAHPCKGAEGAAETLTGDPAGHTILDSQYFKFASFPVPGPASYITADPTGAQVTICNTLKEAISPVRGEALVESNNAENLPAATGTETYGLGLYGTEANGDFSVVVTVHYEPKAAAPAA